MEKMLLLLSHSVVIRDSVEIATKKAMRVVMMVPPLFLGSGSRQQWQRRERWQQEAGRRHPASASSGDVVLDEEEMVGGLHAGELILEDGHYLGYSRLPECIDARVGGEPAANAEHTVFHYEEPRNLDKECLVGLQEGSHGRHLEVGRPLELRVLEVVLLELLLEPQGLVYMVDAVEQGEVEEDMSVVAGLGDDDVEEELADGMGIIVISARE